jgi:hypothetical protein
MPIIPNRLGDTRADGYLAMHALDVNDVIIKHLMIRLFWGRTCNYLHLGQPEHQAETSELGILFVCYRLKLVSNTILFAKKQTAN